MKHLGKGLVAIDIARNAVRAVPVAGDAADAVLEAIEKIVRLAKSVEDTKEECRILGERVDKHMRVIYKALKDAGVAVDGGSEHQAVGQLLETLNAIQDMMARKQRTSESFPRAVGKTEKNKNEVVKLSQDLDDAMKAFSNWTLVKMGEQMSACNEQLLRLEENMVQANHAQVAYARENSGILATIAANTDKYLLTMADVELLETIDEEGSEEGGSGEAKKGGRECGVVRYRGELRANGNPVVVKRFVQADGTFRDEIERAKQLWHPNIAQLRGYSLDPEFAFIAYDMKSHVGSFEALSRARHGVDKLLWIFDATKKIHNALIHLASQSSRALEWTPDDDIDPLLGGRDLVVTPDSRVVLDVSRCSLSQLPNLVVLYDWTISLDGAARQQVRAMKKDPLANVPVWQRRHALSTFWKKLASFASFAREETFLWNPRRTKRERVVCPGECFLRESGEVLDGLCYEDQVQTRVLAVRCTPGMLCPVRAEEDEAVDRVASNAQKASTARKRKVARVRRQKDARRARRVEEQEVLFKIPPEDLIFVAAEARTMEERWRRYTVHGLDYGWRLETTTEVRECGDCAGWLLNQAPRLCDLPLDLDDLAIATALRFTTRTYLVDVFDGRGGRSQKPPSTRTLYFYERVHEHPLATLGMDGQLDWPWSFWSTEAEDRCDVERLRDAHRAGRRHSIAFAGVTEDGSYRWMQIVDDCMMHIDVRVEVEYCKFTKAECMVLDEIQEASIEEDEWRAGPDVWRADVDQRSDADTASERSLLWEEEEVPPDELVRRDWREDDDDEGPCYIDENTVAEGLHWLRVWKECPVYVITWDPERKKGSHQVVRRRIGCLGAENGIVGEVRLVSRST